MTRDEIAKLIEDEIDCGMIITQEFTEETGLTVEQLRKITSCYGAGMLRGETCGAVIAAYNVIGLMYGHCKEHDNEQKGIMLSKMLRFNELFEEIYPSYMCKEIMGADITTKEGGRKIMEENLLMTHCPDVIYDVLNILEEVVNED